MTKIYPNCEIHLITNKIRVKSLTKVIRYGFDEVKTIDFSFQAVKTTDE